MQEQLLHYGIQGESKGVNKWTMGLWGIVKLVTNTRMLIKRRVEITSTKCRANYAEADLTTAAIHGDKDSSDVGQFYGS